MHTDIVWYCGMCHPRHIFAVTAPLHIPHRVVITFLHLFISTCDLCVDPLMEYLRDLFG